MYMYMYTVQCVLHATCSFHFLSISDHVMNTCTFCEWHHVLNFRLKLPSWDK